MFSRIVDVAARLWGKLAGAEWAQWNSSVRSGQWSATFPQPSGSSKWYI